mmetsp:Transcript_48560/g.105267  ORF Transcript_48560/g.105267 Transcript_48560/m.105267 type:complete len:234 (-) Transcript_48560:439-1140(-)
MTWTTKTATSSARTCSSITLLRRLTSSANSRSSTAETARSSRKRTSGSVKSWDDCSWTTRACCIASHASVRFERRRSRRRRGWRRSASWIPSAPSTRPPRARRQRAARCSQRRWRRPCRPGSSCRRRCSADAKQCLCGVRQMHGLSGPARPRPRRISTRIPCYVPLPKIASSLVFKLSSFRASPPPAAEGFLPACCPLLQAVRCRLDNFLSVSGLWLDAGPTQSVPFFLPCVH